MEHQLIESWRAFSAKSSPFLLPDDVGHLSEKSAINLESFDDYISHTTYLNRDDTRFHTGLLPVPFAGSLQQASVFILMTNPGLCHLDYYQEQKAAFRRYAMRTIHQRNAGDDYPFVWLDPQLAWTSGFSYWERKFYSLAENLKHRCEGSLQRAFKTLSQSVAVLELVPYHSRRFNAHRLIKSLPSARLMVDYAKRILVPRARKGDALVIVMRSVKYWGIQEQKGVILAKISEARGAHLTASNRIGQAIGQQLGRV